MNRIAFWCLLVVVTLALAACGPAPVERYFVPDTVAGPYPPTDRVQVVELGLQEIEPTRERLYPDAVVLGRSAYTAAEGGRPAIERFARELGADVVLWHKRWIETRTDVNYRTRPERRVTTIQTREADGSVTETVITTDDPVLEPQYRSTDIFFHDLLFLRRGDG